MNTNSETFYLASNSRRKIPVALSALSAGDPAECVNDYELVDLNEYISGGKEGFIAYKVTGDSMLEYIKPGYLVFVDPYCEPQIGDVIVSRFNGKNNVKILQRKANKLYLVPNNKKYKPQEIMPDDDFAILGVVKGHFGRD